MQEGYPIYEKIKVTMQNRKMIQNGLCKRFGRILQLQFMRIKSRINCSTRSLWWTANACNGSGSTTTCLRSSNAVKVDWNSSYYKSCTPHRLMPNINTKISWWHKSFQREFKSSSSLTVQVGQISSPFGGKAMHMGRPNSSRFKKRRLHSEAKTSVDDPRLFLVNDIRGKCQSGQIDSLLDFTEQMFRELTNQHDKMDISEILTNILYALMEHDYFEEADKLFEKMLKHGTVSEAAFSVIMRYKVKQNGWKGGLSLIKEMKECGINPHSRTYHWIIIDALQNNCYRDAMTVYNDMQQIETDFSDSFYSRIIEICTGQREKSVGFMDHLFAILMKSGFTIGSKTREALAHWFKSDKGTKWKILNAKIDERGICRGCRKQLAFFAPPTHSLMDTKRYILDYAEKQIALIEDRQAVKRFRSLAHHIDITGPYDVIIDILNTGYFYSKGFNSFQVKRTVIHFLNENKKVLVICGPPAEESILYKQPTEVLPREVHIRQLLRFLKKNCGLFFAGSNLVDDYFLIYAVVYSNFNVDLVSEDGFNDHLHKMENLNAVKMFRRWQRCRQLKIKKLTDSGSPIFADISIVDRVIQRDETSWHFPDADGKLWLCCNMKNGRRKT